MKFIPPRIHGILDYITVAFLLASPALFGMHGWVANFTYALAAVHLLMTLLTDFPLGVFKVIPFYLHGFVELIVSIGLGGLAFWLHVHHDATGHFFYAIFAIVLLIVFLMTRYKVE